MNFTSEHILNIPVHFILCTERTGSSLLSLSLNLNPKILSPSEEPFAIFFYKKYKNKTNWTSKEISDFVEEFWLMAEKNLDLFFSSKLKLKKDLEIFKDNLPYQLLIRIIYLQFVEIKPKNEIECIIDKQIKYFFYLPVLFEIFPTAKFCILVRDVRDNVVSKSNHKLNSSSNPIYLSALWNYTYSNIEYLIKYKKEYIITKYENFVSQPEKELKTICLFFNVDFSSSMLETEGKYESFLELRKDMVDPKFINYLSKFQKSLYSGINPKKIGVYKTELSKEVEGKIIKLNRKLFDSFSYEYNSNNIRKINLKEHIFVLFAYLYRPFLLKLYYEIPFPIKLLIKKIRK